MWLLFVCFGVCGMKEKKGLQWVRFNDHNLKEILIWSLMEWSRALLGREYASL